MGKMAYQQQQLAPQGPTSGGAMVPQSSEACPLANAGMLSDPSLNGRKVRCVATILQPPLAMVASAQTIDGAPIEVDLHTQNVGQANTTMLFQGTLLNDHGRIRIRDDGFSVAVGPVPADFYDNSCEAAGKLQPGGTLVEATGGNTGVGLAMGYNVTLTMPEHVD
ncbi:hypothetical protein DIPPA_04961 [Diplonema papillatum]|nr:hypothetical protein DIPPA_04961 [Diplonema papillatum]